MIVASATNPPDLGVCYYILQKLRSLMQHTIDLLERFAPKRVDTKLAQNSEFAPNYQQSLGGHYVDLRIARAILWLSTLRTTPRAH